jgi:hypothetical protein
VKVRVLVPNVLEELFLRHGAALIPC